MNKLHCTTLQNTEYKDYTTNVTDQYQFEVNRVID